MLLLWFLDSKSFVSDIFNQSLLLKFINNITNLLLLFFLLTWSASCFDEWSCLWSTLKTSFLLLYQILYSLLNYFLIWLFSYVINWEIDLGGFNSEGIWIFWLFFLCFLLLFLLFLLLYSCLLLLFSLWSSLLLFSETWDVFIINI